ncbi:vitamin K epoxide reductase family protein [Kordia jejudonensis]|uniref:vitamin K epoxide reductase family protein n=1 Tax=Kordia jejudonensis TaxID=1348245 RepID=UPI000629C72E|nr:vitamin K epoxide reductase family protein [Kordia jejudonensis]
MNIHLDQKEFAFQLESHPDFPSLAALSDTLNLFQVANAALHVHASEIDSLPTNFITKLKDTKEDTLSYVETHDTNHEFIVYQNSKKTIFSKEAFVKKWKGIVFLVAENTALQKKLSSFTFIHAVTLVCFLSFLALVKQHLLITEQFLFLLFPAIGFFLSVIALKHLFKIEHTIFNSFCHGATSENCSEIVHSTHWKFLDFINFSDVSITFFSFQIVLFFIFGFTTNFDIFFQLQSIMLLAAVPILILSLYYQKFIAKKWCTICISIGGIILGELLYVFVFHQNNTSEITFFEYTVSVFSLGIIVLLWYFIKDSYVKINRLETAERKAITFKKNYLLFKNTLISNPITVVPQTALIFGNEKAKLTLEFVTNPFCGFCEAPYFMLKNILERHENDVCIRLFFNFDIHKNRNEASQLVQQLVYTYQTYGVKAFMKALDAWYEEKNLAHWLQKHSHTFDSFEVDRMLQKHRSYFVDHQLTFTPLLIINGYKFPEMYSITDLNYFIEEIIHDHTIQLAESRKAINRVDTII